MSLTYACKVVKALSLIYDLQVDIVRVRGEVTCLKAVTDQDNNSDTQSMLFLLALSSNYLLDPRFFF